MKKVILLSIGGVAIITTIISWWMYLNSPKHSLKKLGEAFNKHDYTTFEKYVDVGSVTNELLDVFQEEKEDKKNESLVEMMRGTFVEIATAQVKKLVENPSFEDEKEIKDNKYFSLLWEKDIVKEIANVRKDGKIAYVDIMLNINKADTILPITAKMRDVGDNWQLFGFEDLRGFFKEIETLKEKRLRKLNKIVTKKIKEAIKYNGLNISTTQDYHSNKNIITITLDLKNTSKKNIKSYKIDFIVLDLEKENDLITYNCKFNWKTGEFITSSSKKGIDQFEVPINSNQRNFLKIMNSLNTKGNFTFDNIVIEYEDGEVIKYLTKKDL